MNLSLFVTLCNKFFQKGQKRVFKVLLSHFAIKTVIAKNLNSVQISNVYTFKICQERRGPLLIDDYIVT